MRGTGWPAEPERADPEGGKGVSGIVTGVMARAVTEVVRSVERKAQYRSSLPCQGPLWANSPVLSPVRLEAECVRCVRGARVLPHAGTVVRMDRSWWLALAAVVLLALVATLVDGWGRGNRPGGRRTRPPGRPGERGGGRAGGRTGERAGGGAAGRPRAAEIWWANVPYEDGPGAKDRPCLVLSVRGDRVLVAKITSRHHEELTGVIPLPPGSVGDPRGRASFLQTGELREVPVREFRRRVGTVDPALWDRVRHLAA